MDRTVRREPRVRRSRRRLTEEQEVQIQTVLRTTMPDDGGPWTREKAHLLTNTVARIELPDRTFSAYLERWGFVPPKPLKKAHQADPFGMKSWISLDYPIIAMQAREAGAEILWLGTDPLPALRAIQPMDRDLAGNPLGEHLLHVSSNRGDREWMTVEFQPTVEHMIVFLEHVLRNGRRIELIVNEQSPFTELSARRWLERKSKQLKLHALPRRSGHSIT